MLSQTACFRRWILFAVAYQHCYVSDSKLHWAGSRVGDFPAPDFRKTLVLSSSESNSFAEIAHGFDILPFLVRVYASAQDGDSAGFKFEGTGSSQNDGFLPASGSYGGILFAYNKRTIRIWVPSQNYDNDNGRVIFVGDGWGGERYTQSSFQAEGVVEAWKEGPYPTFEAEIEVDIRTKGFYEMAHVLHQIPELVSLRISDSTVSSEDAYVFHAVGASQVPSYSRQYGGIIFSYNERSLRLWTPVHSKDKRRRTGCIAIGKGWGAGKYTAEMSTTNCRVQCRMWISTFPPPAFQSDWFVMHANNHALSFLEVRHNFQQLPTYVKVLVRALNDTETFIFEGAGSIQSTQLSTGKYGGVTFAYDDSCVRIWVPSSINKDQAFILLVDDSWGDSEHNLLAESAEIRVQVFMDKCHGHNNVPDAQGYCRNVEEAEMVQSMSEWGKCSNPCGNGYSSRSIDGCRGTQMQEELVCNFAADMCGFFSDGFPWIRAQGIYDSKEKLPNSRPMLLPPHGFPKGSYFVYTDTTGRRTNDLSYLTSPEFGVPKYGCVLRFKYTAGSYFGLLHVDFMDSNGIWKEGVWKMKDTQEGNPKIWRSGYVNVAEMMAAPNHGEPEQAIKRFRFVQELRNDRQGPATPNICPTSCQPVAIAQIELLCEEPSSEVVSLEQCQKKEIPLPGCEFPVFFPDFKGPAWIVREVTNFHNWKMGQFVSAAGNLSDLIAEYRFQVQFTGSYKVWIDAFAINGSENNVYVQVDDSPRIVWPLIYTGERAMWTPCHVTFQLTAGEHILSLFQMEKWFSYRNIVIAPVSINAWSDLGMQSHHIPDSNFDSFVRQVAAVEKESYGRLNGIGGWWPNDQNAGSLYLQIRLPDVAIVNRIATQGGYSAESGYENYGFTMGYKIKVSMDGFNYTYYRNASGKGDPHMFRGNFGGDDKAKNHVVVVTHTLEYAIVARGIRFYPFVFDHSPCLRVELYGFYLTKGMCPKLQAKSRRRPCAGDGDCGFSNAQCQTKEGQRDPSCECLQGYHGSRCEHAGCSPNPCRNGAQCKLDGSSVFQCSCPAGFYGKYCEKLCPSGRYGPGCVQVCQCPDREFCNPHTGSCSCYPGYTGASCNETCPSGFFGVGCESACQCSSLTLCDHVTGECFCPPGFSGVDCSVPCLDGWYGRNCSKKCECQNDGACSSTTGACDCLPGWLGTLCQEPCPSNRYGKGCHNLCHHPPNSTCSPVTGTWKCNAGLHGPHCDIPCPLGSYGEDCSKTCSCHQENTKVCSRFDGSCVCKDGFHGPTCSDRCPPNKWGPTCLNECRCMNDGACDSATGRCTCQDGYLGDVCDQTCPPGRFGRGCVAECTCLADFTEKCNFQDGACNCKPGYFGRNCHKPCPSDRWGANCVFQCSCLNGVCNSTFGYCSCGPGWQGEICSSPCSSGAYGVDCASTCRCLNGASCDRFNGSCNCSEGYRGSLCEERCPNGSFGYYCKHKCLCDETATLSCDHVNGTCYCLPGFVGAACEQTCPDNFYGVGCQRTCPPCRHITGPCNKVSGFCTCSTGYTGADCIRDCDWGTFGAGCGEACRCSATELCSNVDGNCFQREGHVFLVNLLADPDAVSVMPARGVLQQNFEVLLQVCLPQFLALSESHATGKPGFDVGPWCSFPLASAGMTDALSKPSLPLDRDKMREDDRYVARVVAVEKRYTHVDAKVAQVSLAILADRTPVNASLLVAVLSFVAKEDRRRILGYDDYAGVVFVSRQRLEWHEGKLKWVMIGSIVGGVLLVVLLAATLVWCMRKGRKPSNITKVKGNRDNIELYPCLSPSNSHLLAFENPYYDVIAAMGLDDEIEEDYYNPLYDEEMLHSDSDDEVECGYPFSYHRLGAFRNDFRPRNQYPYDKDSGFSSGSLL